MTQIEVNASPAVDQTTAAIRGVLIAVGGFIAGKGWIDEATWLQIVSVVMIVGPIVWGQITARSKHTKMADMATALPDSIAIVKP